MQNYLFLMVFISGMTTLAVEMSASRLLGTYFGTSNLVWASIIGLILIFLAIGYAIGGKWADKSPTYGTFLRIIIWSSVGIGMIPVISAPILRAAANAFDLLQIGVLAASFLSVLLLLSIPMILLGTASPFAIRLAITDLKLTGSVAGRIYAVSTLGSFIGTFLPVMVLIPFMGTYRTFIFFALLLVLPALFFLWKVNGWKECLKYSWVPLFLLALAAWGLSAKSKNTQGLIYEIESAYNYIQVIEQDGYRLLRLNEGQGVHSIYHPEQINFSGPWEQVLVAPFFNNPPVTTDQIKRIAIVGLAAGTTARQASIVYENVPIDGIEIDPMIIETGQKYFAMIEPNLNLIVQDGRWALERMDHKYSIISIDAYRPPYIPFHLTTKEFFLTVFDRLDDQGVLIINVGRAPNDRRLIRAMNSTLKTVFPSTFVVDIPNTFNSVIFASVQPTKPEFLIENYRHLIEQNTTAPLLLETMSVSIANLQPPEEPGLVFVDDNAPIEWITNTMIVGFLFSDEVLEIQ